MVQAAGGLRFTMETLQQFRIVDIVEGRHHFDGDRAAKKRVGAFVDDPHPAFTENFGDLVLADLDGLFESHSETRTRPCTLDGIPTCANVQMKLAVDLNLGKMRT